MDKSAPAIPPFRNAREREQERAAKRDAVLRAAVRMFNERGYHTTSLDDVAASLGISKPLIYHYLGAKEQVLFECLRLGIGRLREAVQQAEALQGNGLERLKLFLCIYAQVIMDDFGRCVIRTGDEVLAPESRAQFRELKREIDEALRRFLQAASDDGSARISDVKLTAFGLAGALNWTARWQEAEGDLPPEQLAAKLVDILLRGIEPRG